MRQLPLLIAILVVVLARGQHVSASSRVRCWTYENSTVVDGPCQPRPGAYDENRFVGVFEPAGDYGVLAVSGSNIYRLSKELDVLDNITQKDISDAAVLFPARGGTFYWPISYHAIHVLTLDAEDSQRFHYCSLYTKGVCETRKISNFQVTSSSKIDGYSLYTPKAFVPHATHYYRNIQSEYHYSSTYGLVGAMISTETGSDPSIGLQKKSGASLSLSDSQREEIFRIKMQRHNQYTGSLLTSFVQGNWWYVVLTTFEGNITGEHYDTRIIGIDMSDNGISGSFSPEAIKIIPFTCRALLGAFDRTLTMATSAGFRSSNRGQREIFATFLTPEILGRTIQGGTTLCRASVGTQLHYKGKVQAEGGVIFKERSFVKMAVGSFQATPLHTAQAVIYLADGAGNITTVRLFGTAKYRVNSQPINVLEDALPEAFPSRISELVFDGVNYRNVLGKSENHDNNIIGMKLSSQTITKDTVLYVQSFSNLAAVKIHEDCPSFTDCASCNSQLHCTWSDENFMCDNLLNFADPNVCKKYPSCSPLSAPTDGTVGSHSLTAQSSAVFTCDPGFQMVGASTLTCSRNGTWSAQAPTCVCKSPSGYTGFERLDSDRKTVCMKGWIPAHTRPAVCVDGVYTKIAECQPANEYLENNYYVTVEAKSVGMLMTAGRVDASFHCIQKYGLDARLVDHSDPAEVDALSRALMKSFRVAPQYPPIFWSRLAKADPLTRSFGFTVVNNAVANQQEYLLAHQHHFACVARICSTRKSTRGIKTITDSGVVSCMPGYSLHKYGGADRAKCVHGQWQNLDTCTLRFPLNHKSSCNVADNIADRYLKVYSNGDVECVPTHYRSSSGKTPSCRHVNGQNLWWDIDSCLPRIVKTDELTFLGFSDQRRSFQSARDICSLNHGRLANSRGEIEAAAPQIWGPNWGRVWSGSQDFDYIGRSGKSGNLISSSNPTAATLCVITCVLDGSHYYINGVKSIDPNTFSVTCYDTYKLYTYKEPVACRNGKWINLPSCRKIKNY